MNTTHKSGTLIVGFTDGIEFHNMGGTMHWNITPLNYTGSLPLPATNHVLRLRQGIGFIKLFVNIIVFKRRIRHLSAGPIKLEFIVSKQAVLIRAAARCSAFGESSARMAQHGKDGRREPT